MYSAYLISTYGKQTDEIISRFEQESIVDPDLRLATAELRFCMEKEMVMSASDFLVRRTGMLYFDMPRLKKVIEPLITFMAEVLPWNENQTVSQRQEMERLIAEASAFT